jgi:hypothetical protein
MSTSLLEAHLERATASRVSQQKPSVERSERNTLVKARKDLAAKGRSVQQAVHSIVLSNPKKKSRKLLKKIVRIQRDEDTRKEKSKKKKMTTK